MHTHTPSALPDAAFRGAVIFNVLYVLLEVGAGLYSGSLALLADAAHNLADVAGLLVAWGAAVLARRRPEGRFTYGFGRTTILAALLNALVILFGAAAVVWAAAQRLHAPVPVSPAAVGSVALIGIFVNAGTAWFFHKDQKKDLNARGAFLHLLADAAVSLAVVLGAVLIQTTGALWIDPVVAIGVSLMVVFATYGLLKASLFMTLDGVPASVDREAVYRWLLARDGVESVHDLHIWALSTTKVALTAHLVMPCGPPGDAFFDETSDALEDAFGIQHATFQVETGEPGCCRFCKN